MIELITRQEALRNEVFASFIQKWQERYDPRTDPYMTVPGVYYDSKIDSERFYSAQEIDFISKIEISEYERLRDPITSIKIENSSEVIFNLRYKDIIVYTIEIGKVLHALSKVLNSKIVFLLEYSVPWLWQKNDFKPVNTAINYLKDIGVSNNFVGGIRADDFELEKLATNLFWIIRCNASLPYCWFASESDPFVGNICKYGSLHFDCFSDSIKHTLNEFGKKHGLKKIDDCIQGFCDTDPIQGRQLQLE